MTAHVFETCDTDCGRCFICAGCRYCRRCGCAEGELLTFCPGYRLTLDDRDAIMSGKVRDIHPYLSKRRSRNG